MVSQPSAGYIPGRKRSFWQRLKRDLKTNFWLYVLVLPVIVYYIVFKYIPIVGVVIGFKNYKPALGTWGSPWAANFGFEHFINFVQDPFFPRLLRNTLLISVYSLIFGFPAPVLLAVMLSEVRQLKYKRVLQTLTYFPHFISTVVVCGMVVSFCLSDGLFNQIASLFGRTPSSFLQNPANFRTIYVATGVWQGAGWSSIIYLAAIAGVDQGLYEAAALDGAGRMRRIWHITLPGIKNTIVILLIMNIGGLMSVGYEKVLLLYNPTIYETADVISTYMYRRGLLEFNFSFSTAIDLFNSVINFALVLIANGISRKVTETSLF